MKPNNLCEFGSDERVVRQIQSRYVHFFVIKEAGQSLGSWHMFGRRRLPGYFLRRMLLRQSYGRPNTFVVAEKITAEAPTHA